MPVFNCCMYKLVLWVILILLQELIKKEMKYKMMYVIVHHDV